MTDTQVKTKDKAYKLSNGGELYLYINKLGAKSWRFNYVQAVTKLRAIIILGLYSSVALAQVRLQRSDIKAQLASGIDPQQKQLDDKQAQVLLSNNTFRAIADDYMSGKTHVSPATITNDLRQLKRIKKYIGDMPITDIRPIDVLKTCRSAKSQGYFETAIKCLRWQVKYLDIAYKRLDVSVI